MVEYSLFDKIKTVFNLITDSPLFLVLLFGILLMIVDVLYISKKDKTTKILYLIVSLILVIFFMHSYLESLLSIFDTIAKNVVAIIYFPTVLEYVLMLIASITILIISIVSRKMKKTIKAVNAIVLITNTFLFFLILDQISKSNVDLSNKISIYTNTNLMMLLELSIIIFVVWIIGLVLYKTIKVLSPKTKQEEEVNLKVKNFYNPPNLPTSFEELQTPNTKTEYIIIERQNDNMFTLEEYQQMKEYLEAIKKETRK